MMTGDRMLLLGLGLVFLAVLMPVSVVALTSRDRRQVNRSLEGIAHTRFGATSLAPPELPFTDRVLKPLLHRCSRLGGRLTPSGAIEKMAKRLDLAGNPVNLDVERILAFKAVGLVLGVLAAALLAPDGIRLVAVPLAGALGLFVPDLLLTNRGQKRQLDMRKSLPDALDLLTISVEAGLGFDAALLQVARRTSGPLAGEFFRVLQEMQIGKSRAEAFRGMAERTTVAEFARFSSAIVQADTLGIPIANVLREQAAEMRLKRSQRAEEQAHKVPVKILFPMVLFLLPAIFVIIIGPGALTIAETF